MSVSATSFGFPDFASDFPVLFIGLSRFCIGLSRFSSAHSQRSSGGGHATIGRWSRGHRAVVAGNVLGKIGYMADWFHRYRKCFSQFPSMNEFPMVSRYKQVL